MSVFEKLRFRNGLVWTVGLIIEMTLRFQIYLAGWGQDCCLVLASLLTLPLQFATGELGGNMGLLLGCSLLTILEFIDFLWEVVMSKKRKRSRDEDTEPNNGY